MNMQDGSVDTLWQTYIRPLFVPSHFDVLFHVRLWIWLLVVAVLCTAFWFIRYVLLAKYKRLPPEENARPAFTPLGPSFDLRPDVDATSDTSASEADLPVLTTEGLSPFTLHRSTGQSGGRFAGRLDASNLRRDGFYAGLPSADIVPAGKDGYADDLLGTFLSSVKAFGYLDKPVFHELARHVTHKLIHTGEVLFDTAQPSEDGLPPPFYIVADGSIDVFASSPNKGVGELSPLHTVSAGGTVTSLFDIIQHFVPSDPLYPPIAERSRLMAKAAVTTSLAVIPASAFQSLPEKFPMAGAHIIHVLLSRFANVTFATLQKTLGLTKECIAMESALEQWHQPTKKTQSVPFFLEAEEEEARMSSARHKHVLSNLIQRLTAHPPLSAATRSEHFFSSPGASSPATTTSPMHADHDAAQHAKHAMLSPPFAAANHLSGRSDSRPGSPFRLAHFTPSKSLESIAPSLAESNLVGPTSSIGSSRRTSLNDMDMLSQNKGHLIKFSGEDEVNLQHYLLTQMGTWFGVPENIRQTATDWTPFRADGGASRPVSATNTLKAHGDLEKTIWQKRNAMLSGNDIALAMTKAVEFYYIQPGSALVEQGTYMAGCYVIISGELYLTRKDGNRTEEIGVVTQGNTFGYTGLCTRHCANVSAHTRSSALVAFLSREQVETLIEKCPSVGSKLAQRITAHVTPLIHQVDVALEWGQVPAGQVLFREGDSADALYIVLNGRLRSISEKNSGRFDIFTEYGQGQSVGELDILTGSTRNLTVHAIRDTEIVRMSQSLFLGLAHTYPEVAVQVTKSIAKKLGLSQGKSSVSLANAGVNGKLGGTANGESTKGPSSHIGDERKLEHLIRQRTANLPAKSMLSTLRPGQSETSTYRSNDNMRTVCLLPTSAFVPIGEFAERLKYAMDLIEASSIVLNHVTITRLLGKHTFSRIGRLKLQTTLYEYEERFRLVIYVADSGVSTPWTQKCIRQADCIMLVGLADDNPSISEYEHLMLSVKTTARKELVLIHPEKSCPSGLTAKWLKNRMWITAHHHVLLLLSSASSQSS